MALVDNPHTVGSGQDGGRHPDLMTWVDHLTELRRRLLICMVALTAGTFVAWFAYDHVIHFMIGPYRQFLAQHPTKDISGGALVTSGPLEGFTTRLKVSASLGAVLAAPVGLWQLWRFVTPGLHRSERRWALPFMASALTLAALGVLTAVLVFPKAISWMISVSGTGVAPLFSPGKYLGLYALCCVVFAAVFTYPVILVLLEVIGLVPSSKLRQVRRPAIVAIVATAAVVTPSNDPFSFLAMAVPMLVFYEGAILVGRLLKK
jgi:sec-independent protein translocase protein TatC